MPGTENDAERAALAKEWNRHKSSIALPGEHPIARRPRVASAPRYDATNVDYRKLIALALSLGRKELPGAHLTSIRVRLEDGRADLASTALNKLTFTLGSADKVDGDCSVVVEFGPRQVDIYFDKSMFCNSKAIRAPTCSTASVWERAGRPDEGKPSAVVSLEFTGASWEIGSQRIPDDCGSVK